MATTASEANFYVTGGTLRPDALSYVERQADADLLATLRAGEYCYVLNSRQMGKSSLCVRAMCRLREEGIRTVFLDLQKFGGRNLTAEQWYAALLADLGRELGLRAECLQYWKEHPELPPVQRLFGAIREVALGAGVRRQASGVSDDKAAAPSPPSETPVRTDASRLTPDACPLVIFVDEIDVTRSLPFNTDEFFAAIRQCYVGRATEPALQQVTFCLLGTATPAELIEDTRISPFNIGRRIEVRDFTPEEAAPLASGLAGEGARERGSEGASRALLERILYWTGGHPYLTQRLCRAVADSRSGAPSLPRSLAPSVEVDRLCAALFLTHTAKEGDDNLSLVRNRLLKSEADLASLLDLYGKLRAGKGVADDETNALCGVLKLSGVANVADGRLRVKNRIYERVFDRGWVAQHMPDAELRRQRAAYRRGLVRAAGVSAVVLAVIGALALAAIRSDARAKLLAEDRRKALYAAQMNLAYQAYRSDAVGRAVALLEAQRPQVGQQDLRGFDWRYLWQRCHGDDPAVLPPNPAGVFAVAYSPPADPRGGPTRTLLATGDGSGAVQLWDAAGPEGTARRLATLEGHEGAIDVLAFSPDGKRLATASGDDGKVKVWDLASRRGLFTRPGTRGMFARLAFSPDGKLLAIASEITKSVNVWAVAVRPGEPQPQTPLWSVPAWGPLAFSPDGKTLAIAAVAPFYDGFTVTWCDVEARQVLRRSPTQSENGSVAWCAAFSPDGKTLATGDDGKNLVILWDVATGQKRGVPLTGHTLLVWSLAFSPDSKTLASGSCDGTVKLWDVAAGKERSTLHGHTGQVRSVAFSPDGRRLASGSPDGSTRLWATRRPRTAQAVRDRRDLDEIPVRTVGREFVIAFAFSPEGQILAVATTHSVTFWNTATRKREKTRLEAQRDADCFFGLAFTPDGAAVATGSQGGTVRLWNRATGELIAELRRHRSFVFLLGFAAGGRLVTASGGEDPYLRVWDLASPGRSPAVTREIPGTVGVPHQAIAVSRDGKIVVMGSPDNRVRLWEVASGRPMGTLEGRISSLHSVAITPDGRIVAGAGLDGRVILWDRNTGRRIRALSGHRGAVLSMDFSPDGRTLATGSMDRTVKLWNPAIDQEVATFSGYGSWVWRVQFSPDGNTLASAGMQGPVWLRRAAPFVETDASQGGR